MAGHKLTMVGQPAVKKIQAFLQHGELQEYLRGRERRERPSEIERRLAYADGVIAISGAPGIALACNRYGLDLAADGLIQRFHVMVDEYGFQRAEDRKPDVCAEARLWMTLVGLHSRHLRDRQAPRYGHPHPRHLHAWVYQIDRKNRPKEDSPCRNCRQWVRQEFQTVNGTS